MLCAWIAPRRSAGSSGRTDVNSDAGRLLRGVCLHAVLGSRVRSGDVSNELYLGRPAARGRQWLRIRMYGRILSRGAVADDGAVDGAIDGAARC